MHSYFEFSSSWIDLTLPSEFSYYRALEYIIPSAQHIVAGTPMPNTGRWFDLATVQHTYSNAAWPSNQDNTGTMNGRLDVFSLEQLSSFSSFQIKYSPFWALQYGLSS